MTPAANVVWCDPASPRSVADAMMLALSEPVRSRLAERGPMVAARHGWVEAARAHLEIYARLAEVAHA